MVDMPFFKSMGLKSSATEISDEIVDQVQLRMEKYGIAVDIRKGLASDIPFDSGKFDYLLTWNSCYYMSLGSGDFDIHVAEMARVIRPGGWIVCSVPKKDAFIFKDSKADKRSGYRVICNDYFGGMRNGEIMRVFDTRDELENTFSNDFSSFCHADINMNWFGLSYRWHVFVAKRK